MSAGSARESVSDYPSPPRLEPSRRHLVVVLAGAVVAETTRAARVVEERHGPTFYFPPADVAASALRPAALETHCPWKGDARYYDVVAGDRVAREAAWSYPDPFDAFAAIRDWIAFYPSRLDACLVDGVEAWGDYYGGWITPEIEGPFRLVEE